MHKIYVVLEKIEDDEFNIFEVPKILHENSSIKASSPIYKKAEDFAKKILPSVLCEYELKDNRLINGKILKEFPEVNV